MSLGMVAPLSLVLLVLLRIVMLTIGDLNLELCMLSADNRKVVLDVTSLGNPSEQAFLISEGKGGNEDCLAFSESPSTLRSLI